MNRKFLFILMAFVLLLGLTACDTLEQLETGETTTTTAGETIISGTFTAHEVNLASLVGGEVETVTVDLGDVVEAGDLVFSLNTDMIDSQIRQAETAVISAETQVQSSILTHKQAELAHLTLEQQLRLVEVEARAAEWQADDNTAYDLPIWYFNRADNLKAAETELAEAEAALKIEQENLSSELADASNADIIAAEERLAAARETYRTAKLVEEAAQKAKDNQELKNAAEEQRDSAEAELEAAQLHYDQILSSTAADAVLEARARVAAAQRRADLAQDRVDELQTGQDNLQLDQTALQVAQAELLITQSEANRNQANAALETLITQLKKHEVYAPIKGLVLARTIEPGEILNPSATAIVIGQLDTLTLKIFLPEDQYGKIQLGQEVNIRVDSFPGETFNGTVVYIADQAEYTPRNVQTVEGRRSTVFAVEIRVPNPALKLKPGMPADVFLTGLK